ncbi:MAG: Uncharacterised protein [Candidatus Poseidoniaceae archaeon]|nr:MAG: Uncharacterised protein [Candidatus Poseidoniaceae archaeon]
MQETLNALRQIPYVTSVQQLSGSIQDEGFNFDSIQHLLANRKKITLIGKNGCVVFFAQKSNIVVIRSEANVNLGAIDLILDSIE